MSVAKLSLSRQNHFYLLRSRIKSFHPSQIKFGREAPVLMFIGDEQKSLALVQDILFYHQDIIHKTRH